MELIDTSKSLLENIYYICGPLILLVTLIGLRQISIARKSIIVNSVRDAAKFSIEISEKYDQKFNDAYLAVSKKFEKYKIKEFDGDANSFDREEYDKIDKDWLEKWNDNYKKFEYELIGLVNLLESYSIPIIKKISDEDMAFNSDCYQFIHYTRVCYPYIFSKHDNDELKLYSCFTKQLFDLWNKKLNHMYNEKELQTIKEKMKFSEPIPPIKPIGTE